MAAFKLLALTLLLALIFAQIGVDADASISGVDGEDVVSRSDGPDPSTVERFTSKISSLESHIEEKTREIKQKDEVIAAKEMTIKDKSDSILSLESEVASLQKKSSSDAEEQVGKIQSKAGELEKEVKKLREDIDAKIKENNLLEAQASEAEKKSSELNSKFDGLQKTIDDQKKRIRKYERALQIAEDEMMKTKIEAATKIKELMEVHSAWLPPWLGFHFNNCQTHLQKNWKVHGEPALETLVQKAIEKKAQAEELLSPHVETIKTKWVPAIKEQWAVLCTNIEPHVHTLTTKTVEIYEVSKAAVTPHVIKAHELADPYYQELRKFSKPYIDHVATAARPHVDKLHTAVKPYTKQAVHAYTTFLESATTYHYQVQELVHEKLKSNEFTKAFATKELVWFSASALLAMPIIFLMNFLTVVFGKKSKKPIQNSHAKNPRRKGKRVHADK